MNSLRVRGLGIALLLVALVLGTYAVAAEVESTVTQIPGGAMSVDTIKETVTIKAINAETREITLETADGETDTIKAGPAVVNFDKLAVNDKVNITLTEAVAVYLGKDEAPSADAGAAAVRAPKGGAPGGVVVGAAQITAKVTKLNVEKRRATLQMPDGSSRKIKVREGIDLSKVAVGDSVTIEVTEGIAIDVEKP